jgi:hypothetical protein
MLNASNDTQTCPAHTRCTAIHGFGCSWSSPGARSCSASVAAGVVLYVRQTHGTWPALPSTRTGPRHWEMAAGSHVGDDECHVLSCAQVCGGVGTHLLGGPPLVGGGFQVGRLDVMSPHAAAAFQLPGFNDSLRQVHQRFKDLRVSTNDGVALLGVQTFNDNYVSAARPVA